MRQRVVAPINRSSSLTFIPGRLGTILHLNGAGPLCRDLESTSCLGSKYHLSCTTHTISAFWNFGSTGTSTPFLSKGFNILNTANTLAITPQTDGSPKCLPGQLRRPNPNARFALMPLGLSEPSSLRNRSGTNSCGFENLDSSCDIDLANGIVNVHLERMYIALTTSSLRT